MKKTLLLDVDGVLLDYFKGFCDYFDLQEFNDMNKWQDDFSGAFSISDSTVCEMVEEFNNSDKFGNLVAREDCSAIIRSLKEKGFTINLLTSCGASDIIKDQRIKNLYAIFGEDAFNKIDIIPLRESKSRFLEQYKGSGFMWVEDSLRNYYIGEDLGLHSVLIKTPFNYHTDSINMVNDWESLYYYILNWYQV